jgi:hypothetical protein
MLTGGSLQTSTVPLSELPHLMRALGYYPSEQELLNMVRPLHDPYIILFQ